MRLRTLVLTAVIASTSACTDASGPQARRGEPRVPELKALSPSPMTGEAGFQLAEPVRVQLLDTLGAPLANETVTFEVVSGGGSVNPASAMTDAGGVATTQWTLGTTPGTNTLKAFRGGSSVQLTATGADGIGASIVRVSGGTTDSLAAGCTVPEPLVVRVLDKAGQPAAGATVSFDIITGDGSVTSPTLKTGTDGVASTKFRVGFQGGANVVRAVLRTTAKPAVEFSARSAPAAPNGYSVMGNKIFDPGTCAPILFHGAARPALESWYNADDQWAQFTQQASTLKSWGANVIRIPVSQSYWVPGTYWNAQATAAGVDYKAKVKDAVDKARALGLAVIIDLHSSDRGDKNYKDIPDIWKMPDVNHSVPFWRDVATMFKGDGGVMFELYNEPHPREDVWVFGEVDLRRGSCGATAG